ncbi:uncharacterized protein LOC132811739 [Hemiscyllium ocellatum]|uniref:uncharacterized protein LOC132811739 n=1 Tax=Hemiscyllium ocellatum TaxID=170820 RepID=UPI002966F163|nr:uncharacterized protein LOC132811739 [Hemiscyllium ocellatum]
MASRSCTRSPRIALLQFDPSSNQHIDPSRNQYIDPSRNQHIDPSRNQHIDPSSNQYIDPSRNSTSSQQNQNQHIDPSSNQYIDPSRNQYIDPSRNQHIDHSRNQHIDPSRNQHINPSERSIEWRSVHYHRLVVVLVVLIALLPVLILRHRVSRHRYDRLPSHHPLLPWGHVFPPSPVSSGPKPSCDVSTGRVEGCMMGNDANLTSTLNQLSVKGTGLCGPCKYLTSWGSVGRLRGSQRG